jgi:dihydrofolate reductase
MSKLKLQISVSLDGYVAGPNQSEEQPLGEGGEALHDWAFKLAAWREPHGEEGGEVNPSTEVFEEATENVGAVIMGRNMFGGGPGPWSEEPWEGWWGDEPPFGVPVFVLTHHEREPLVKGETTFHFVTDGIESALGRAREVASGKDVAIGGGGETIQQYLAAGEVDEMWINVAPLLLGGGTRLLDNLGPEVKLEQARVIEGPDAAHLKYRLTG